MQNIVTALQRLVNILGEPAEISNIEVISNNLHHDITLKFQAAIENNNTFYSYFYFSFVLLIDTDFIILILNC